MVLFLGQVVINENERDGKHCDNTEVAKDIFEKSKVTTKTTLMMLENEY